MGGVDIVERLFCLLVVCEVVVCESLRRVAEYRSCIF